MSRIIEIIISPDGQTRLQTKGFTGASCQDASKGLEAALGIVTSDKKAGEFHAIADVRQDVSSR